MKILVFVIAVAVVALGFLSRVSLVRARANQTQNASESVDWAAYKNLLFVDQSLNEILEFYKLPGNAFIRAQDLVKNGKPEEAKQVLRQVLADPGEEVRTKLWAWNCLRQLGEKPPPNVANQIQGIVMEIPVEENWIDILAAYSDGHVRYLNGKGGGNGQGGAIIWEKLEEKRISSLVATFMSAAKPIVGKAPVHEKHLPAKNDVVRFSLLTYGGVHIIEAGQADITPHHSLSPVYTAGEQLFLALLDENEKAK